LCKASPTCRLSLSTFYGLIKVLHVPYKPCTTQQLDECITLWGMPEQDIGSHCNCTHACRHTSCYTCCTLIHHTMHSQDRWRYTCTAESTLTTAHKGLGGPSIATKIQVTAAFLPFVLLPVVREPAVPPDKMSIQTCGLRTRCPQDEMSPPHLRLTRVGIARD